MARPKKKGVARKPPLPPKPDDLEAEGPTEDPQRLFNNRLAERRIASIEAIKESETENLMSRLRYVRSYMTKEQMGTPALKFFEDNFRNLSVIKNDKENIIELKWKEIDTGLYGNNGGNMQATNGGLQFSIDSVKESFFLATTLHYPEFNLEEFSQNQVVGATGSMQTPGAMSSFGMTPKTERVPKNGEMLLSVRGSPLGVYKEESGDGSPPCGSDI